MRSGLGLPERRLKMLMKIRSARLCFLGNLIYFSCTTVSLTPVFHVLGHGKLCVLALGLVWPRSDTGSAGWEQSGAFGSSSAGPWGGSGWEHGLRPPGQAPAPVPPPHRCPSSTKPTPQIAQHIPQGSCGKSCFFFQNNPRRVRCQGEGCEEPRRFIAEEILSPARADGRSRNNGRFAT